MVKKIKRLFGGNLERKIVGLLGLAFKQDTDDMRDLPAIVIINGLLKEGAIVKANIRRQWIMQKRYLGIKLNIA